MLGDSLYEGIGNARFAVSFSSNNAVVCVYWKDSQKNAKRHEYRNGYLRDSIPFVTLNGQFSDFLGYITRATGCALDVIQYDLCVTKQRVCPYTHTGRQSEL